MVVMFPKRGPKKRFGEEDSGCASVQFVPTVDSRFLHINYIRLLCTTATLLKNNFSEKYDNSYFFVA